MSFFATLPERAGFNPLDRGNLYLILLAKERLTWQVLFQSPRSGKFVSNMKISFAGVGMRYSFNPLDRGNLYLMTMRRSLKLGDYIPVSIP